MMRASIVLCLLFALAASSTASEDTKIFPNLRKKKQQAASHHSHQTAAPEEIEKQEPVQSAEDIVVPDASNVGPDGFPMLTGVSETLKDMSTEASALEAKLVQAQIANQAAMAKKKATLENKLKLQETSNRLVIANNNKIEEDNKALKESNVALKKHAKELQEGNHMMRTELKVLQQKLGVARDFVLSSMKSTDDSKAAELVVLGTTKHKHHHVTIAEVQDEDDEDDDKADSDDDNDSKDDKDDDNDQKDSDSDDDDSADSFLEVSLKRSRRAHSARANEDAEDDAPDDDDTDSVTEDDESLAATPTQAPAQAGQLLDMLGKGVAALSTQEKASEAKLKVMFNKQYQAGLKRHTALIKKQKLLNTTRASLTHLQEELRTAESHLEETRDHLEQRLRGVGLFMQRIAHLALAPATEAPKLMDNLPGSVPIPGKAAKSAKKVVKDESADADSESQ